MVNIGAGFDTLFWRLKSSGDEPLRFVELDFPEVTAKKTHYIQRGKLLLQSISHDGKTPTFLVSTIRYQISISKF